jgi:hypothetical protein
MGFFNFIETFFFISLAITFILIMMLVYHFKDRLSILENKCDTMYNIIDDMAKEVNQLHAVCSKPKPIVQDPPFHMHVPQFFPQPNFFTNKIIVSDNEDSDYSSDEESDDEREREGENSDDGIVITESEIINHEVLAEIDDSLNVPITEVVDVPEDSSPIEELVEEDVQVSHEEDVQVLSQEEDGNDSIGQDIDTNVYKKMEVSALRSLVLSKGLATDVKKLKKTELIDLLILQS